MWHGSLMNSVNWVTCRVVIRWLRRQPTETRWLCALNSPERCHVPLLQMSPCSSLAPLALARSSWEAKRKTSRMRRGETLQGWRWRHEKPDNAWGKTWTSTTYTMFRLDMPLATVSKLVQTTTGHLDVNPFTKKSPQYWPGILQGKLFSVIESQNKTHLLVMVFSPGIVQTKTCNWGNWKSLLH